MSNLHFSSPYEFGSSIVIERFTGHQKVAGSIPSGAQKSFFCAKSLTNVHLPLRVFKI